MANELIKQWSDEGRFVKVCPEVLGGMSIPRPPAQIVNGHDVLKTAARVIDAHGNNVTVPFVRGAELSLISAMENRVQLAILKEKSPSCGGHSIYDVNLIIKKFGVTTAILRENGIKVFSHRIVQDNPQTSEPFIVLLLCLIQKDLPEIFPVPYPESG